MTGSDVSKNASLRSSLVWLAHEKGVWRLIVVLITWIDSQTSTTYSQIPTNNIKCKSSNDVIVYSCDSCKKDEV